MPTTSFSHQEAHHQKAMLLARALKLRRHCRTGGHHIPSPSTLVRLPEVIPSDALREVSEVARAKATAKRKAAEALQEAKAQLQTPAAGSCSALESDDVYRTPGPKGTAPATPPPSPPQLHAEIRAVTQGGVNGRNIWLGMEGLPPDTRVFSGPREGLEWAAERINQGKGVDEATLPYTERTTSLCVFWGEDLLVVWPAQRTTMELQVAVHRAYMPGPAFQLSVSSWLADHSLGGKRKLRLFVGDLEYRVREAAREARAGRHLADVAFDHGLLEKFPGDYMWSPSWILVVWEE